MPQILTSAVRSAAPRSWRLAAGGDEAGDGGGRVGERISASPMSAAS
jgi:hypothetical protein